jgi:type IV pilus assembly protein PilW
MIACPKIQTKRSSRGFTFVEILVVLVIMVFVVSAVYTLFSKSQWTYTAQEQIVEKQQNSRAAMEMISRELRVAGFDPNVNRVSGAGLVEATGTSIRFTCDLNANGNTNDAGENIRYALYVDPKDGVQKLEGQPGPGRIRL